MPLTSLSFGSVFSEYILGRNIHKIILAYKRPTAEHRLRLRIRPLRKRHFTTGYQILFGTSKWSLRKIIFLRKYNAPNARELLKCLTHGANISFRKRYS